MKLFKFVPEEVWVSLPHTRLMLRRTAQLFGFVNQRGGIGTLATHRKFRIAEPQFRFIPNSYDWPMPTPLPKYLEVHIQALL